MRSFIKWAGTLWGGIIIAVGWVFTVFHFLNSTVWPWLMSAVQGMNFSTPHDAAASISGASRYLALVNTVLPLEELLTYLIAYLSLVVLLTKFKLWRAHVPFMKGLS
jgi:hypothetical protein